MNDPRYTHSSIKEPAMIPEEPGMCLVTVVATPLAETLREGFGKIRTLYVVSEGFKEANLCWGGYEHTAGIGEFHDKLPTVRLMSVEYNDDRRFHVCPVASRPEGWGGWFPSGYNIVIPASFARKYWNTTEEVSFPLNDRLTAPIDRRVSQWR